MKKELTNTESVVGTSRCDVRGACSGATSSNASVARIFLPPATTRAGTAQRAIPTIALDTYPAGRRAVQSRWIGTALTVGNMDGPSDTAAVAGSRTSNIQHPTSNIQLPIRQFPSPPTRRAIAHLRRDGGWEGSGVGPSASGCTAFDVRCSMLDVRCFGSAR